VGVSATLTDMRKGRNDRAFTKHGTRQDKYLLISNKDMLVTGVVLWMYGSFMIFGIRGTCCVIR